MHIKVFTCAPWNNMRLGNETDHILHTPTARLILAFWAERHFNNPPTFCARAFCWGGDPEGGY